MKYVVASNLINSDIDIINIQNHSRSMLKAIKNSGRIRSIVNYKNSDIIYSDVSRDTINRFNLKNNTVSVLNKCIGKYPSIIKLWKDFIVIACSETDTIEMCSISGQHTYITHKLGSLLSDIYINDDICYAICTLSEQLYLISIPDLKIIDIVNLSFSPNSFYIYNNDICILGSKENVGIICRINRAGDAVLTSQTPFMPINAVFYKNNIVLSCPGEDMLCFLEPSNLQVRYCIKMKNAPGILYSYDDTLLINLYYMGRLLMVKEKTYKAIYTLQVNYELSDITLIDM